METRTVLGVKLTKINQPSLKCAGNAIIDDHEGAFAKHVKSAESKTLISKTESKHNISKMLSIITSKHIKIC